MNLIAEATTQIDWPHVADNAVTWAGIAIIMFIIYRKE